MSIKIMMGGVTRRPLSAERNIEVSRVKFTRARDGAGEAVHVIEGAHLRWLTGLFEETAVITYETPCGRHVVDVVPVPDGRRVTCVRCRSALAREKGGR